MVRVKRGKLRATKRKRLLVHAKGFKWRRKNVYKIAKEAVAHAWANMYVGRKQRKRDMRKLWTVQINAACRQEGVPYSRFIYGLKKQNIQTDRKVLAELARTKPDVFKKLVAQVKIPKEEMKL